MTHCVGETVVGIRKRELAIVGQGRVDPTWNRCWNTPNGRVLFSSRLNFSALLEICHFRS